MDVAPDGRPGQRTGWTVRTHRERLLIRWSGVRFPGGPPRIAHDRAPRSVAFADPSVAETGLRDDQTRMGSVIAELAAEVHHRDPQAHPLLARWATKDCLGRRA